jgi:hypothetical protein
LPQLSPMTQMIFAFEQNYRMVRPPGLPISSGAFIYWGSVGCNLACAGALVGVAGWLLPRIWRQSEAGARVPKPESPARSNPTVFSHRRLSHFPPLLWLALRSMRESPWLLSMRLMVVCFFGLMLFLSVTTRNEEECFIAAICAAYGLHLVTRIQLALTATRWLTEDRRSGALEALLTTPVTEAALLNAYHESLRRAFLLPMLLVLGMNAALQLTVFAAAEKLRMNHGAWAIFTAFFVGGGMVTLADFSALSWLCLRASLCSATQMKAAGRAFGRLCLLPWPTFAGAWLVAIQFRDEESAALVFLGWAIACVFYDLNLVRICQQWLRPGLRRRISEG